VADADGYGDVFGDAEHGTDPEGAALPAGVAGVPVYQGAAVLRGGGLSEEGLRAVGGVCESAGVYGADFAPGEVFCGGREEPIAVSFPDTTYEGKKAVAIMCWGRWGRG